MNDYFEYLRGLGNILQTNNQWLNVYEEQMNAFANVAGVASQIARPANDVLSQYNALTESLIPKHLDMLGLSGNEHLIGALDMERQLLASASFGIQTPEITALQGYFRVGNLLEGIDKFVSAIQIKPYTSVANVAFLCNSLSVADGILDVGFPRGTKTFMKGIHKKTANKLAQCDDIEVSFEKKIFHAIDSAGETNAVGMNIIVSSIDLLSELSEKELLEFIDVLSNQQEMAMLHPVGKQIYQVIEEWTPFVDFEEECYYHGRPKKENGMPYTSDEMGKAPNTCVTTGRYNHMNQSHYYFSDTVFGAEAEVKKHNPKKEVQIARLKPKRSIRMIDLSQEIATSNVFLKSLRYELSDDKLRKEYLLPCFVTSCCKRAGIEGVKYYGTKQYTNFVCWEEGYFDVSLM